MMTNARWKDRSVEKYDYAKYDDDGIYQGRSFLWNLCGGIDYQIAQAVHQISLGERSDGVVPKKEKIVTWIRDYTGNEEGKQGSLSFETVKTFTHTQHYAFPMKNTATATYYNQSCDPELDSMVGAGFRGCYTLHNRTAAANDQARKAIAWLENKYPDKVCTGDEKIYTVGEWEEYVESQQDEDKDEDKDEDTTAEVAEEPDNSTLYLIIGGVVVIGGIVAYQMSQE